MSKYLKDLITGSYTRRLEGVQDALLVNVVGLDANRAVVLRKKLREKNMRLLVVKNSLARRATEGTPLSGALTGVDGNVALVWGGEDIISLAKEICRIQDDGKYPTFVAKGGIMDGEPLNADRVRDISKWPSRGEQLSLLVGQILGPGSRIAGALLGPGGALASQVKKKGDEAEGTGDGSDPPAVAEDNA